MPDAFAGAEASVDQQRQSALDALAQFGRRGLEAAVDAQNEGNRIQSDAAADNAAFLQYQPSGSAAAQAELAALGAPAAAAYAKNGSQAASFIASENNAAGQVNSNFYNQVKQAVPMARTSAAQMVDEYRAAYAERRASAAAAAQAQQDALAQAAAETELLRLQMGRDQELFDLQMGPEYAAALAARQAQVQRAQAVLAASRNRGAGYMNDRLR